MSCNDKGSSIATLSTTRNFIQVPGKGCKRQVHYYGKGCQFMQVSGVVDEVRGSSNPIRSWNRQKEEFCTIGNTLTPPGIQTVTVEFYEDCGPGIPFPYSLGRCRWRAIINHGLCNNGTNVLSGWSRYVEVLDLLTTTIDGGKRTSYDGSGDPLQITVTAELHNKMRIGPMSWSRIDLDGDCMALNMTANSAVFGCYVGCGHESGCSCGNICDDGTQRFYVAATCTGGANQLLLTSSDGGETTKQLVLPQVGGLDTTPYPQVALLDNTVYYLGYENPPVLMAANLDMVGNISGAWSIVGLLTANNGTVATGVPSAMVESDGVLHILVEDATNGSRYYQYDGIGGITGPEITFDSADGINHLSVSGDTVAVAGDSGSFYISYNSGNDWETVPIPATFVGDIQAMSVNGARLWISGNNGQVWTSVDGGETWQSVPITGNTTSMNSITFAGDDIGWMANGTGAPYSTWLGGSDASLWTNRDPRIVGWPKNVDAEKVIIPCCAGAQEVANTVLVLGKNALGSLVAYMGSTKLSGV